VKAKPESFSACSITATVIGSSSLGADWLYRAYKTPGKSVPPNPIEVRYPKKRRREGDLSFIANILNGDR